MSIKTIFMNLYGIDEVHTIYMIPKILLYIPYDIRFLYDQYIRIYL